MGVLSVGRCQGKQWAAHRRIMHHKSKHANFYSKESILPVEGTGPGLFEACPFGPKEKRVAAKPLQPVDSIGRRDWTRTNDPHHVKVV
ncbi:hypothetical protein, partial [Thermomonas sp.]|uniref:hypothetical protein n=1 Tax=Thermomonas sp. TaxID=1971895 RepID=UPI002C664DF5